MSLKVVLDKQTWTDALTDDSHCFFRALIDICDQIVINENIRKEYGDNSALIPMMESLAQRQPKRKIIEPRMGSRPGISIHKRQHRALISGAIRAGADIIIMKVKIRGKWEDLAEELKKYNIRILTPEEYIDERNTKSNG
jgi:hypothetical protein